jgi:hypothetical protein
VGVADQDPADRPGCGGQQGLDVHGVVGTGVDQGPAAGRVGRVAAAQQVAVGARAGHDAAVAGGDAQQAGAQRHRLAGADLCVGDAAAGGVDQADFRPGRVAGVDRAELAAVVAGQAGLGAGDRAQALRPGQRRGHVRLRSQFLQQAAGRVGQGQAGFGGQGCCGGHPALLDQLHPVQPGLLAGRQCGEVEPGVEAFGHARRGEPVGHRVQLLRLQAPALCAAELIQLQLATVQRVAAGRARGGRRRQSRGVHRRHPAPRAGQPPRSSPAAQRCGAPGRRLRPRHLAEGPGGPDGGTGHARSPASTNPPGKTQALLFWSPWSARRSSSTSRPSGPSRRTAREAEARGTAARGATSSGSITCRASRPPAHTAVNAVHRAHPAADRAGKAGGWPGRPRGSCDPRGC